MPRLTAILDPDEDADENLSEVEEEAERALSNGHSHGAQQADKHGRSEYMQHSAFHLQQLIARVRRSPPGNVLLLTVTAAAVLFLLLSNSAIFSSSSSSAYSAHTQHLSHSPLYLTTQRSAPFFSLPSTSTPAPYPSLTTLITTSPSAYPGLTSLLRCTTTPSTIHPTPHIAVFTTASHSFTAAHIALGLLDVPWCTVVLSLAAEGEERWEKSVQAGVADYLAKQALNKEPTGDETEATLTLDRKAILARTAFITRAEQSQLPYAINGLSSTPAAIKNLGYLLAIHAGATVVFDGDDSYVYQPDTSHTGSVDLPVERGGRAFLSSARVQKRVEGQAIGGAGAGGRQSVRTVPIDMFNPYPLYGGTSAWPRGFPLSFASSTLESTGFYNGVCPNATLSCTPVVQHLLPSHAPDVDAHYQLGTRRAEGQRLSLLAAAGEAMVQKLAREVPSVVVERGAYSVWNSKTSLITQDVFFGLLLPTTVDGSVSDIWRSYVMQTLFTYFTIDTTPQHVKHIRPTSNASTSPTASPTADPCLLFSAPHFYHDDARSQVDYHNQLMREMAIYTQAEALVAFLAQRQRGRVHDILDGRRRAAASGWLSWSSPSDEAEAVLRDVLFLLYVEMYEAGVVEAEDVAYAEAWLTDIASISASPRTATPRTSSVAAGHAGSDALQVLAAAGVNTASTTTQAAAGVSATSSISSTALCFPPYLSAPKSSRPLPPMNVVPDPYHIEASDGRIYTLFDYKDGFLWPDKWDGNVANEERLGNKNRSRTAAIEAFRPWPPHKTPPKPSVDFIMRTFSGYTTLVSYLLRSMDLFVPWRQLGDLIVVLDDNDKDRQYATSLPDDVKVFFEQEPMWLDEWGNEGQSPGLGIDRAKRGYALGLYSNWLSDRYSNADYICVLDPDMLFMTKGSLPLMFDWDVNRKIYKPIWLCRDFPESYFVETSYKIFGLDESNAPGCMFQLPVCVHRSTLRRVRQAVTDKYYAANASLFDRYGVDPKVDRDSDLAAYKKTYDVALRDGGKGGKVKPLEYSGLVPPSAFDRTYVGMINRAPDVQVCQFCVWGSYILTNDGEHSIYSFYRMGAAHEPIKWSRCPQIRAATHAGYLIPQPKIQPAYYTLADSLFQQAVCIASLPSDCNQRQRCAALGLSYDARAVGRRGRESVERAKKGEGVEETLDYGFFKDRLDVLWKFEAQGAFQTEEHEDRCGAFVVAQGQQLLEWIQTYDLATQEQRDRLCLMPP